jgi:ADP-ribose pyrophosphatase YjhB (NUDIX family)
MSPAPFPPADRPVFLVHASAVLLDGDRVLMVQEAKPASRGKWNLPGGHVDHGESPIVAATRETVEEVCVTTEPVALVGIYASVRSIRFVVRVAGDASAAEAGDEILAVRWLRIHELLAMPDDQLVSPSMLRRILLDLKDGRSLPLDAVRHVT